MIASQAPPVYGGAGAQALRLGQAMVDGGGCEVELLTLNQLRAPRRETLRGVLVRRCPGESILARLGERAARRARSAVFIGWLFWRLALGRYDVLHVHGAYWWTLPAAVVGRLRGVPLVVKVTRLGEDDAQTVHAKRVGGVPVGRLYGLPFRWADAVIGISQEIVDRHRRWYPGTPVHHLPNGVDTDTFRPDPDPDPDRRAALRQAQGLDGVDEVVLFVGYLAPLKGLRALLTAWRSLDGDPEHGAAQLVLAGPDRGFYRELDGELLGWIEGQQAAGRVSLLGHVELAAMPDLYRSADLYVLPSLAEGMPNSLLEALASGLPAVVTDIPGTRDVIAGCAAAEAVPVDDDVALAAALRRGLSGGPERRAGAVAHVEARFSLRARAVDYRGLYEALCAR